MSGKTLALSALLWMILTPYRQERLSLPITHAAVSQAHIRSTPPIAPAPNPFSLEPGTSCYKFILLRPKDQRATAVQVRLKQADAMVAALERTITVDLVGDHANILSLQFPMPWPARRP